MDDTSPKNSAQVAKIKKSELFPTHSSVQYVQTQWATDWHAYASGFDQAAEILVDLAKDGQFGAEIDQVGLAVFFLERHRLELVLKGAIEDLGGTPPRDHSLQSLWATFSRLATSDDRLTEADLKEAKRLLMILAKEDPTAEVYRYPIDKEGHAHERAKYINLEKLHDAAAFVYGVVSGAASYLDELAQQAQETS